MSIAYFTFFAAVALKSSVPGAGQPPLTEATLAELGGRAWEQLDQELRKSPYRMARVRDSELDFEVEVYELCNDDVGLEQEADGSLSYGVSLYSEQVGLELTGERLAEAQRLYLKSLEEAAQAMGLPPVDVRIVRVLRQNTLEVRASAEARSLEQMLAEPADEGMWVALPDDGPPKVGFSSHKVFALLAPEVHAYTKEGSYLRSYRLSAPQAKRESAMMAAKVFYSQVDPAREPAQSS